MTNPASETNDGVPSLDSDRRPRLQFRGWVATSDAGLPSYRELEDSVALAHMASEVLNDGRAGKNVNRRSEWRNAFTAAWVMRLSFDPLLLALSINPRHSSHDLLKQGRAFSVNVLKNGQLELAAHFGGPARADKLALTGWTTGRTGAPLLREALTRFECRVEGEHPAGDHVLVVGKVIDGKLLDPKAEPVAYRETRAMDRALALFPDVFGDA